MKDKAKRELVMFPISAFMPNIGKRVMKRSGKPFKSGEKIGTVKDVVIHAIMNRPAYTFVEDDSQVECWRCEVI